MSNQRGPEIKSLVFEKKGSDSWTAKQIGVDGAEVHYRLGENLDPERYLEEFGFFLATRMGYPGGELELDYQRLEPNLLGRLLGREPFLRAVVTPRLPQEGR